MTFRFDIELIETVNYSIRAKPIEYSSFWTNLNKFLMGDDTITNELSGMTYSPKLGAFIALTRKNDIIFSKDGHTWSYLES